MKVTSALFVKGVVDDAGLPKNDLPQVAFIGRSNVGKSSVINSLTGEKGLARSSSTPGLTREINFFLVDNAYYLVDLPGYGYAKGSFEGRDEIRNRIEWYLLHPDIHQHKIVMIVDAKVGMTEEDLHTFRLMEEHNKDIVIVANKVDKLGSNDLRKSIAEIEKIVSPRPVIRYSSEKHIGMKELLKAIAI